MKKSSKKVAICLIVLLILGLVLPESTWAGVIPGPFDFFNIISEQVEESAGPIMARIIAIFTLYAGSMVALVGVTHILDKVIFAQSEWLTLSGTEGIAPMVDIGLDFTLGLANILMILFLVFIAFQFIFKIDTPQTKKSLITLLIVALLLNFSRLFIEIALDITDIIYKSILTSVQGLPAGGGESFLGKMTDIIIGGKAKVVRDFGIMLGGWVLSSLVPGGGAIKQLIVGLAFLGGYLPIILGWIIQAILFFLISGTFLIFSLLFGARIYIIAFLTILSPLAFLSLILPQTKKYFNLWFKHFSEWLILGIFFIFFLALGVAGIHSLMPEELYENIWLGAIPFLSWKGFTSQMVFYFFLFCFFAVVLYVGKKSIPAMGEAIISSAQAVGGMIWARGIKPLGGAMWKEMRRRAAEEEAKEEAERKAAEARGEKYKPPRLLSLRGAGRALTYVPVRWATRTFERVTPEVAVEKEVEVKAAEYEKRFGTNVKAAATFYPTIRPVSPINSAAMALYLAKMKGAKGINELSEEKQLEAVRALASLTPRKLEDVIKHKPELIDEEGKWKELRKEVEEKKDVETFNALTDYQRAKIEGDKATMREIERRFPRIKLAEEGERIAELIQKTMVPKGMEDEDVKRLIKEGIKIEGKEDIAELIKTAAGRAKVIKYAATKKAAAALKAPDIDNLAVRTLEHPLYQEVIVRYQTPATIRRIGEEKDPEYIEMIHKKAIELGAEEIAKTNATLLRQAITNPGFRAVFPPIPGALTPKEVDILRRFAAHPELRQFDKYLKGAGEFNQEIRKLKTELKKAVDPAVIKRLRDNLEKTTEGLNRLNITIAEARRKVEENPELKRSWDEIERLRRPARKGK